MIPFLKCSWTVASICFHHVGISEIFAGGGTAVLIEALSLNLDHFVELLSKSHPCY